MAPNGGHKGKGMGSVPGNMPISVINQCLSLDQQCIKEFISELICALIQVYNVCGLKDGRVWVHLYDIIFRNPVMTYPFSQF